MAAPSTRRRPALAALALAGCVLGGLVGCAAPPATEAVAARQAKRLREPPVVAPAQVPAQMPADVAADTAALVPFIDAHVHLNDEPMQLALMQRHGAQRAVVFWGRDSDNASIADSAARHPERFIAFASISPERASYRAAWEGEPGPLLDRLDALLASGRFSGIGEISATHFPSPGFPEADFDPQGPMVAGILALARKHRMPVLLHVEWTRLQALSGLLERFPEVPVIWAHGGYTPLFVAQRMLERHANLHYELSARTWPQHPRSPDYTLLRDGVNVWPQWLALIEARPERFLIGSDASQRSQASDEMKLRSVQSFLRQLSPATREQVARGNILRLIERPR